MPEKQPLLVDGHLDIAWNVTHWNRDMTLSLDKLHRLDLDMDDGKKGRYTSDGRSGATVCIPEMTEANMCIAFATGLCKHALPGQGDFHREASASGVDGAYASIMGQWAVYRSLESRHLMRQIRQKHSLAKHVEGWKAGKDPLGYILWLEGADSLAEPRSIRSLVHDDGLRGLSLSHYLQGRYAMGTHDESGEGVTKLGLQLLKEMEQLNVILDLTHLTDEGFWQALDNFDGAVCATHCACRSLVPRQRQLTDEMIGAIVARGGIIGIPFDCWMLHSDWEQNVTSIDDLDVTMDITREHFLHVCELAGNANHVAIGSDLDGGFGREQCPSDLQSIADLQQLPQTLDEAGFKEGEVDQVMGGNWIRFLGEALPEHE